MANTCRTEIRTAWKYNLEQITTANGYNYDIRRVYDPIKSPEQMTELPAVNLDFGVEECANWVEGGHLQTGGNRAILHNQLDVVMDVFMQDVNDIPLAQEKILADIQKRFGNFYWVPNSDGTRTVFNCIYKSSNPFGLGVNKPNCGISITYVVWYRQSLTDPTVLG
jgi:hypothetical protein